LKVQGGALLNSHNQKRVRANEQIRVPEIRLIGAAGEQIGVVPTRDGLTMAEEAGLDLVEIAATVKPPVCRIMDLGKYLYSIDKKEKESRKKQHVINLKEVKMTSKIEEHDYQTKLRNARRFLDRGDKVKLTLYFRGREITHSEIGQRVIARMIEDLSDVGEVEKNEGLEGKIIQVYITQKGAVKKTPPTPTPPPAPGPSVAPAPAPGPAGPAPV
jgi:translation initiation factor IF-3